jgi:hypothetical protein
MKNILFAALLFGATAVLGLQPAAAQQTREHILLIKATVEPQAAGYMKIGDIKGESNVKEGRNVIGTNTRTGNQIVVIISNGRISQVGEQVKGQFNPIRTAPGSACATIRCEEGQPTCYTLSSGECFCLCPPIKKETPKGR